mmetsp:Transcript_28837/g.89118  ORF Transcript_28837/g.89118 Transcript_28837/m.89118 type:complete len:129 (-) Transcript_28837:49-435(-)
MTRSIAALTAICAHAYAFRPAAAAASRRMSTARSFSITETVGAADVVIFSKSWCPFCDKTKKALRGEEIEFSAVELDKRDDGADIQAELAEMTGQRTVPSVWIKGTHIGGNDDTQAAIASGKLAEMLA